MADSWFNRFLQYAEGDSDISSLLEEEDELLDHWFNDCQDYVEESIISQNEAPVTPTLQDNPMNQHATSNSIRESHPLIQYEYADHPALQDNSRDFTRSVQHDAPVSLSESHLLDRPR